MRWPCPNRQFLLTWQSELPHQENIQFGVQGPSDFEADRHAAPGKSQDQGLGSRHERQDLLREDSTRLAAISKEGLDSHVYTSKMSHLLCLEDAGRDANCFQTSFVALG